MNIFLEEHQQIVSQLIASHVEFLLIGGYAVIYHGYNRTTGDMDLWLNPTNANKDKVIDVLAKIGYASQDLDVLAKTDFTKQVVFSIGNEPQKIDFITIINLVSFEEANQNKILFSFEGLQIPIINIRELILSKMNTGRKKDEADIEELQRILNYNKPK